jgi:hypothetical protein
MEESKQWNRSNSFWRGAIPRVLLPRSYTTADIGLLARTDELHDYLSGLATKKIMEREEPKNGSVVRKHLGYAYILKPAPKCSISPKIAIENLL